VDYSIHPRLPYYNGEVGTKRKWKESSLSKIVEESKSFREVLKKLGLVEAGGNYEQVKKSVWEAKINTSHFTGKGWRKGLQIPTEPFIPLKKILVRKSYFQSYKLKKRLFKEGLKFPKCELCGWAEKALDGRIPLELDHISGNRYDNRLDNLRILCPNCHSLQPTHRGRNIKRRSDVIGSRTALKTLGGLKTLV
jgi:5-methylcytosine-specific restriction endonuclease McrA